MRWLIALAMLATPAVAQTTVPYILHMPQQHDQYGGIRNRENQLCCNREDCKKIVKEDEVNIKPDGGYVIRSSGEFVTEGKVADSPDENWHICRDYVTAPGGYTPTGRVRCLMIPQGGY